MNAQEIGEIRREFKPGLENLFAGVIIGLLLIGFGCAGLFVSAKAVIESRGSLPLIVEKGPCWAMVGVFSALGIGAIVCGVFLIRWIRSLSSLRVAVGVDGLSVTRRDQSDVMAWADIVSVRETRLYERPPLLKGVAKYALPKVMSKNYRLEMNGHEPFHFDGNAIKGHVILAEMIKKETDRRDIPWDIVEEHA
jgi:hypothetical protein